MQSKYVVMSLVILSAGVTTNAATKAAKSSDAQLIASAQKAAPMSVA
jgi:hypothetical protein